MEQSLSNPIYYNQLEVEISVFSTPLRSLVRLDNI